MHSRLTMGIDPSFSNTGIAIIKEQDQSYYYIDGHCISTNKQWSLGVRLELIYDGIRQFIEKYQPAVIAMEGCFVHRNFSTAIKLGMVQGAVRLAVQKQGKKIQEYSPRYVRKMIASRGSLGKTHVMHWLNILLHNFTNVTNNHIIDAAAVALCGIQEENKCWLD